jgi:hypothetical protein
MPETIHSCRIYPGIGIARLGDSEAEYFIGPESPGTPEHPQTQYKDREGRILRQAARFHIFAYDAAGNVIDELSSAMPNVSIEWRVELANTKASGNRFVGVRRGRQMDAGPPDPGNFRNGSVQGPERSRLEIRPSPRTISGRSRSGSQYAFEDGVFFDTPVYLGELRTDPIGRLLVLGGRGRSGSVVGARPITTYANNDGWYDDTADGRVTATITVGAQRLEATPAWVIVAPPKFAPHVPNVVTLYEVMAEAFELPRPARPSFTRDVYPLFSATGAMAWVNAMALRGHGSQRAGAFASGDLSNRLADASSASEPLRRRILGRLRHPSENRVAEANYNFMPLLSGDEGDATVGAPQTWLSVSARQYAIMEQWAAGNFESDWEGATPPAIALDDLPAAERPVALDRASLEPCVGGPFFPGIELTYIAREKSRYSDAFRFDAQKMSPGEATRRMAIPWQADFYECAVHWWPAQRPDDVLNEESFRDLLAAFPAEAGDGTLERVAMDRIRWDRGVGDRWVNPEDEPPPNARTPRPGDNDMVEKWRTLGFVVPVRTAAGELLQIETGRSRYDGLRDRDYFYYLLNIDSYPDFLPVAQRLAEYFLSQAVALFEDVRPGALDELYRPFPYSRELLQQRLDEIYAALGADAANDPIADPENPFRTREDMIERIRQFAPLNQMDGAWVRNVGRAGPIDDVGSLLFSVWMDEVGNGDPNQNHANVYTNLLEQLGIQLPPITTRDYASNPDLLDSAYTVPVFELAISQFTDRYFPEILGMTLQLEWEVLGLWPTVKLLRNFGLDSRFYELHIGIDNAASGHGAKAKQAVERFLDDARRRGGDDEVQAVWKRIWTGYVAFATTGTLASDLRERLEARRTGAVAAADRVDEIILEKKKYGALNHSQKQAAGQYINDLFEDPTAFRDALVKGDYVVPGHPEQSRFFQLTSFQGPMYRVFTEAELDAWKAWVFSLRQAEPAPIVTDPATLMAACIDRLRAAQQGTPTHQATELEGPNPDHPERRIRQPLSAWFEAPTRLLMQVLADPTNGWIVPGNSTASRIVNDVLAGQNAMRAAFAAIAPNSGGLTWAQVLERWIDASCPLVPTRMRQRGRPDAPATRLALTTPADVVSRHPRGWVRGMGVVH